MCVGPTFLPLLVDESKYSFRSYFRPVGPCNPPQDTSPKSKIQPKVKPMETAGFDQIITDSHSDWILSYTQTVSSSFCDCDWLISDRVFECIPPSKHHLWSVSLTIRHEVQYLHAPWGRGWYMDRFLLGMYRWPPAAPSLYSKIKFACIFSPIFFNVLLGDF